MESTRFHSPQMRLSKPVLTVVIALFALSTLLLHAKFNHEEQIMVEMGSQWENLISSPLFDLNMSALCREDQKRYQRMNYDGLESLSDTKVQAFFAQVIQFPVQTACFTMKRVGGGKWRGNCYDGHKYVCLDDLIPKLSNANAFHINQGQSYNNEDECIVYSFGIAEDLSFETAMTHFGCHVFAYDKDWTEVMKQNKNPKITVDQALLNADTKDSVTFGQLLARNNHTSKIIKYLKVDIEGWERQGFKEWIRSGAMDNVIQIGVEFHHTQKFAREYWQITQSLHQLGFIHISYDPNLCVGRGPIYFECVELVFRKTTLDCPSLELD